MEPFAAIAEIASRNQEQRSAVVDGVRDALDRLERHAERLGAVISINADDALAEAKRVQVRIGAGEILPLAGVPFAAKDNICTAGWATTCGSRLLENFVPPYDASAVRKLREAGAVLVCKTNMDEFGMGSSTENSAFFPCRNPWDLERTPGGSSGGSAAVVASGLVPAALGSDTGGSIRQPAAFCGTVGLKPTYGRVSRYGLVAFGSSLDQIGPMTRTVEDAARIFAAIAGHDPADATSAPETVEDPAADLDAGVRGLRIGIPREYTGEAIDEPTRKRLGETANHLEAAGAVISEVSLPHTPFAVPTYYVVATSEASSNLARHAGVHAGRRAQDATNLAEMYLRSRGQGLGPEVIRRILLGTFSLSTGYFDAYYRRAMRTRSLLKRDFDVAFEKVDVLLAPTTPTPAFRLGEKIGDPLQMYLADVLTVAANLAGIPGLAVPAGFVMTAGRRLPVGLQLLGPAFSEALLLRAGREIEKGNQDGLPLPDLEEAT